MATFKICIFKHQKRQDDKFPVSIRVCWKRQYGYIRTEFYVSEKQIVKKTFSVKDTYIINELNRRIEKFEDVKSKKLGFRIELFTAKELADYFQKETSPDSNTSIDFISFSRLHCERLRVKGRDSTAATMTRTINSIIDFCNGRDKIYITEITAKFLTQLEVYLRGIRTIKRKNQFGRMVTTKKKGLSDVSIIDYMTDIRTLFNAAVEEYNDEDKNEIRIVHYPFRKYKLKKAPTSEKRNISITQLQCIRSASANKLMMKRTIFARDIFMLSFYLVGMNFADLYEVDHYENGRLSYERMKTKRRRQDRAFISIKVEPEAAEIIEKYRDKTKQRVFDFHRRYSNSHVFSSNVNLGLKKVATACEIKEPLSTYYARHSWATIARNKCGVSMNDVDLALNHIDQDVKMADIYIEKDWSLIDIANRAVIDQLNIEPLPSNNQSDEMPKSAAK